jgi:hypothetical protein
MPGTYEQDQYLIMWKLCNFRDERSKEEAKQGLRNDNKALHFSPVFPAVPSTTVPPGLSNPMAKTLHARTNYPVVAVRYDPMVLFKRKFIISDPNLTFFLCIFN